MYVWWKYDSPFDESQLREKCVVSMRSCNGYRPSKPSILHTPQTLEELLMLVLDLPDFFQEFRLFSFLHGVPAIRQMISPFQPIKPLTEVFSP
jgi:hypothetical protein